MFHGLNNDFLYTAVKIEVEFTDDLGNITSLYGTAFFVKNKLDQICLVTNRHIFDQNYKNKSKKVFRIDKVIVQGKKNSKDPTKPPIVNQVFQLAPQRIVFADNYDEDVAALVSLEILFPDEVDATVDFFIPHEMVANEQFIESKLSVCDFVAFPGYPEWHDKKENRPILRTGSVASDPRTNYSYGEQVNGSCIAYEAFSFGGSSGSPVFALQKGMKPGAGINFPSYRELKFIGINAGHLHHEPSKKIEGTPNQHSGISYFYKSSVVLEVIDKTNSTSNFS